MRIPSKMFSEGHLLLAETRALTYYAVTMLALTSMLPRTDFEYGQI